MNLRSLSTTRRFLSEQDRASVVVCPIQRMRGYIGSTRRRLSETELEDRFATWLEATSLQVTAPGDSCKRCHFDRFVQVGNDIILKLIKELLLNINRVRINTLALGARLPTMWSHQESVEAGGLMSYGPNFPDQWRRAADYVDKILRGAKPGDLPVEQPTKFDVVINLTTAKALRLKIPETLLLRADEVIE